ncbi:hypothetical protein BS78_07G227500 [Paspalum vaginatum]|nr:hypothetical protein BS78_07G227500 [Paspalum vaginatum]
MAFSLLPPELVISTLVLASFYVYTKLWNPEYTMDWPVLGMLPPVVAGLHSFQDNLTVALAASACNIKARGPLGSGMRFFVTSDPSNVRHIFTSNHANYPKGEDMADIFDIIRGTLFTVDGEPCRQQRAMNHSILNNPRLLAFRARLCRDKVVNGLLPFLARMASSRNPFDMRELLTRLVFDLTATPTFGVDPGYLSMPTTTSCSMMHMPSMHVCTAMDTVMDDVGLLRHALPPSLWKAMRHLDVGPERKLAVAHKQLHGFLRETAAKRKPGSRCDDEVEAAVDILFADPVYGGGGFPLYNILILFMFAGRDTVGTALPWLFYSLAKNPRVVSAIRKELAPPIDSSSNTMVFFEPEETKGLVYLEAAILETLRLYPPGPLERKTVLADDVLLSGHRLCSGETILVSIYAMGRMEALWGEDCHEYKPERWLSRSNDGAANKLRYVPSHKFMAFNSGPRLCLGKDIALEQMKTVVAAVVWNFDVELLQGQIIEPKLSCTLQMKNRLMVTANKTN